MTASILNSLGLGRIFPRNGPPIHRVTSGFGARLTWALPFGLLIRFADVNRFDPACEEAAWDGGASPWQLIRHLVFPITAPWLLSVELAGTLYSAPITWTPSRRPHHSAAVARRGSTQFGRTKWQV